MQGQPRDDREWEHWPGRRAPDDGIRHRLKALFAATDDEESIEALIVERSRELEEQTERLQATIEDLERREEQAGRLRSAVEEMLRHGSAELDERHAELSALSLDLRARDERVREQERDLAVRKQELGAVELRRAAVERREAAAAEREAALEQAAAELRDRELRLADAERTSATAAPLQLSPPSAAGPEAPGHLLYLADGGYRIAERDGRVPGVDALVEVDGRAFVVVRVTRSPLPGDLRACAYLEPAREARRTSAQ
jgi:hypothetical protein